MTEQPTSTGPKCPKCFHPQGAPDGDHYTTCPDYQHPSGAIAGTLAEFYASPEYRAEVLTGRATEQPAPAPGPCACWSCDGECGGTQTADQCGPLADVDGRQICQVCREAADVFGNDRMGAQALIRQDRVRLTLKWAGPMDTIWLDSASARHLAAVLTQRADELDANG